MVAQDDIPMIEVSIPSMEREADESGKSKKVRTPVSALRDPHGCFGIFRFLILCVKMGARTCRVFTVVALGSNAWRCGGKGEARLR